MASSNPMMAARMYSSMSALLNARACAGLSKAKRYPSRFKRTGAQVKLQPEIFSWRSLIRRSADSRALFLKYYLSIRLKLFGAVLSATYAAVLHQRAPSECITIQGRAFQERGSRLLLIGRKRKGDRHPACIRAYSNRLINGFALRQHSKQTFNFSLGEWTPFHWSSYEQHKTRTLSFGLSLEGTASKIGKPVIRYLAPRGQRRTPRLLTRAPGIGFNDDQRGRDVD